ncbi:MAG: papain-like cysteine protease family protein [Patescibacteria group bacterium]
MVRRHGKSAIRCWLFAGIALVLALAAPLNDAAAQQVPNPVNLNVPLVRQETPVWCWLAVSEMIIRYRNLGMSMRQCEMLEIGYGLPGGTCCGDPMRCQRTGYGMQEVQLVLAQFGGVVAMHTPPLNPIQLYGALQSGHPVIVQIRSGQTSSHVIVIRGMRFEPQMMMTPYGPQMGVQPMLLVNDPLGFMPAEVPFEQLVRIWMDSLIIQ